MVGEIGKSEYTVRGMRSVKTQDEVCTLEEKFYPSKKTQIKGLLRKEYVNP